MNLYQIEWRMSPQILLCGAYDKKLEIFHLCYYISEQTNERTRMLKQEYTEEIESLMKKSFQHLV